MNAAMDLRSLLSRHGSCIHMYAHHVMFACMCSCMYSHLSLYNHTSTYPQVYTYMYIRICICIRVYIRI